MILENSMNNEMINVTGITDSTLLIMQEFLSVIENSTMVTKDIAKLSGSTFCKLAYKAYTDNYEVFRNKVCQEDVVIFEKLVNYICASSFETTSIRVIEDFKDVYSISETQQFGATLDYGFFNTEVGVEYSLMYKTKTFTGVFNYISETEPMSKYCLHKSYSGLFNPSYLSKISDGLIKVNRFKEGSYVKMKFLINTTFDEFKVNIFKIMNEDLFKKWQFKGLCNDLELIQIRYLFKLKNILLSDNYYANIGNNELKSLDLVTFNCINFITERMQGRFSQGVNPHLRVQTKIRDILLPMCMHYFIPENDREFFHKFVSYITYVTPSYSTMGYNGLTEISREKSISILENMGKMERLIGKVVYGKSISKKDMTLNLNTFSHKSILDVSSASDMEYVIKHVTNLESYINFNPYAPDESALTQTNKFEPFKHLGISEEGMYLALMAIKNLYEIPAKKIRDDARETIIKRAKRFVDANDYNTFCEIITKFTTEEDEQFCYVPSSRMDLNVSIFQDSSSVFKEGNFINQSNHHFHSYKMLTNSGVYRLVNTFSNTNNLRKPYKEINELLLNGSILRNGSHYTKEKLVVDSLSNAFISIVPHIKELSWKFSEYIIDGCPHLRNKKICDLVELVLGTDYGFIASPKENANYEEYEVSFSNENGVYDPQIISVTPIDSTAIACDLGNAFTKFVDFQQLEQDFIDSPKEDEVSLYNENGVNETQTISVPHINNNINVVDTNSSNISTTQDICEQNINTVNSSNTDNDTFVFNWLDF